MHFREVLSAMAAVDLIRKRLPLVIGIALALATALLYLPMLWHGFLIYDDPDYITGNEQVRAGLTWPGIVWAFQGGHAANWHPLTWISHMLDCQLFGLHPAGHHLTNLLLHTANSVLLFVWLNQLTGATWRSAFVAALFAWHPMHVESVAWAAERKDVLSAFFWMLTLLAYTRYARKRSASGRAPAADAANVARFPAFDYFLALFFLACGLLSKPMVVTLPFVLLLLDFWPLQRFGGEGAKSVLQGLILEKIPFFALTLASCLITFVVQHSAGAFWSTASLPVSFRLANAMMAYLRYISKLFWPTDLSLIYPYPHHWPTAGVVGAVLVLAALSAVFVLQAKRFPYLAVGWLWYLGTMVPVIGLVQVGLQSMADRYMYLPSVGLFILFVWGANDLAQTPRLKKIAAVAGGAALAGCLAVTSVQLRYWQDSVSLLWHSVKVTNNNYAAMDSLGLALDNAGKTDAALKLFETCVQLEPDYPPGQFDLGMALLEKGRDNEASNHLAIAARFYPRHPVVQFDFGTYLLEHGRPAEAATHFHAALAAKPDFAEAHNGLGQALLAQAKTNAAIAQFTEAVRLKPDYTEARQNLARALGKPAKP
jgi:protein O-mannosyl-transferase